MIEGKVVRITGETYSLLLRKKIRKNETIDSTISRMIQENQFAQKALTDGFGDKKTMEALAKSLAKIMNESFEIKPKETIKKIKKK